MDTTIGISEHGLNSIDDDLLNKSMDVAHDLGSIVNGLDCPNAACNILFYKLRGTGKFLLGVLNKLGENDDYGKEEEISPKNAAFDILQGDHSIAGRDSAEGTQVSQPKLIDLESDALSVQNALQERDNAVKEMLQQKKIASGLEEECQRLHKLLDETKNVVNSTRNQFSEITDEYQSIVQERKQQELLINDMKNKILQLEQDKQGMALEFEQKLSEVKENIKVQGDLVKEDRMDSPQFKLKIGSTENPMMNDEICDEKHATTQELISEMAVQDLSIHCGKETCDELEDNPLYEQDVGAEILMQNQSMQGMLKEPISTDLPFDWEDMNNFDQIIQALTYAKDCANFLVQMVKETEKQTIEQPLKNPLVKDMLQEARFIRWLLIKIIGVIENKKKELSFPNKPIGQFIQGEMKKICDTLSAVSTQITSDKSSVRSRIGKTNQK